MLTPRFEVSQNDEFIFVKVFISNVRFSAAGVEMVVNDNLLIFSLPPYYLRLRFPKQLVEDERATSQFVPKEECIDIRVPKLNKGEHFEDLDLSAKLLARLNEPSIIAKGPMIEEIDAQEPGIDNRINSMESEGMEYDWEVPQTVPSIETTLHNTVKYGFNNQYSDQMTPSLSSGNDINELTDPDHLQPDDRIMERMIKENIKFDMEYYANDYITFKYLKEDSESSGLTQAMEFKSPFKDLVNEQIKFNQDEHDRMKDLPRKSYIVDDPRPIYYTILSLLFSYSYEMRSVNGELNVESAWCIGKLTPQISCLDSQMIQSNNETENNMLRILVLTMSRRALDWPLFRHFELVKKSWEDVYWILRCGRRAILKVILELREGFRKHDVYYVYCRVLLDDLCSWILKDNGCNDNVIRNLAHSLKPEFQQLSKEDVVFEKIVDGNEEGELQFLSLVEVEEWADEAYNQSIQ